MGGPYCGFDFEVASVEWSVNGDTVLEEHSECSYSSWEGRFTDVRVYGASIVFGFFWGLGVARAAPVSAV